MGSEWEGRIAYLERRVSELKADNATHKEEKALFFNEIDRLKAENANLTKRNTALEKIRLIAEDYVTAPPQMKGGVFRNLDKHLIALKE